MNTVLEDKGVLDIEGHFGVPAYQRGYRWGEPEVTCLLEDIFSCKDNGKYYLQPVVVRRRENGDFELIDGQQRLTTLFLLLSYLQKALDKKNFLKYFIAYEIRENFLDVINKFDEEEAEKNIDYFHIFKAYCCITEWFKNHSGSEEYLYKKLDSVRIIWYETGSSENPNDLFTRLNIGKIPLTNAELVKALFLSESNAETEELKHEIAYQWDYMEKELQNDSFWFFLSNNDDYQTRIDLVLELIAGKKENSWEVYETFFYFSGKDCKQSWSVIQQAFSVLKDWYEDCNFYHKIGYLLSVNRINLHTLFNEFKENDKKSFDGFLDGQIKESIKSDTNYLELTYGTSNFLLYRLLLLFNIETVRQSKDSTMRFPFDSFKKVVGGWSLEHIHAQQSEGLSKEAQWKEWLESHKEITQKVLENPEIYNKLKELLDKEKITKEKITREEFENVQQKVMDEFSKKSGENYLHSLANLALLGKNSNAVLNNSVFAVKRDKILKMDREGEFIPICTKMVFLKYYGQSEESQVYFWGSGDRKAYLEAINDKLKNYLSEPLDI